MATATKEKPTYSDLLTDPRWQKKRLKALERAAWACEDCGHEELTLHVHHRIYVPGRKPWDYPDDNFVACCFRCHSLRELIVQQSRMIFQIIPPALAKVFLDRLAAHHGAVDEKVRELALYMMLCGQVGGEIFEGGAGI